MLLSRRLRGMHCCSNFVHAPPSYMSVHHVSRSAPVALVDGVGGGQHAVDQLRVDAAHLLDQVRQQRL